MATNPKEITPLNDAARFEGTARYPLIALDLMRGLAALTVLISHLRGDSFVEYGALPASQHNPVTFLFFAATRVAFEAVVVFFVLSGFLVGGQVLTRLRQKRFEIDTYIIDRATRILIPLVPACLFMAAVDFFWLHKSVHLGQLIANMIGLNEVITPSLPTNAVLWSLAYEIWFYVSAGAVAYLVSRKLSAASFLTLLICIGVFTILKVHFLIIWILGACVSLLLLVEIRLKKTLLIFGVTFALIGTLFDQLAADSRSVIPVTYLPPAAELLVGIGIAMTFPFFVSASFNRLLSVSRIGPFATALAGFSYTLYLTHRPTDAVLGSIFGQSDVLSIQSIFFFCLRILICLGVAVFFYLCFERNTSKARKFIHRLMRPKIGLQPVR